MNNEVEYYCPDEFIWTGVFMQKMKIIRFFADHLAKELMTAEEYAAVLTGTKQYVMLGAGLDTLRFPGRILIKTWGYFEVDHPLTQKDKIERITHCRLDDS